MRILHLIDPAAPGGGPCTLRLVDDACSRLPEHEHDVLIVGNGADLALARRCGLDPLGHLAVAARCTALARGALRNVISAYESAGRGYDLLHAWTESAALLAAGVFRRAILATLVVGPTGPLGRLRRRAVPVLVTSPAIRREYEAAGLEAGLLSVVPPAVGANAIGRESRPVLRESWDAGQSTFMVGLAAEPVHWAHGPIAFDAAARVHLTGRDVRLLVHPATLRDRYLGQWLTRVDLADRVVVGAEAAEPWRVLPGLDAVLFICDARYVRHSRNQDRSRRGWRLAMTRSRPLPGILPVVWAMAAGVPVVAEATDALCGIIKDGRTGLLVEPGDANAAAACLLRLYDDSSTASRIGTAGRDLVRRRFACEDFTARINDAYIALTR